MFNFRAYLLTRFDIVKIFKVILTIFGNFRKYLEFVNFEYFGNFRKYLEFVMLNVRAYLLIRFDK
eukprot:Pgem_evm1s17543